jgi:hypothetical protein
LFAADQFGLGVGDGLQGAVPFSLQPTRDEPVSGVDRAVAVFDFERGVAGLGQPVATAA